MSVIGRSTVGLDERPLARALLRRGEERARTLRLSVREATEEVRHGIRAPRLQKPVRPEPNAPLLMRIVRTPYALAPVPFVRVRVVEEGEAPAVRIPPSTRPGHPFAALLAEIRGALGEAAPVRPRPQFVPPPFARRPLSGARP